MIEIYKSIDLALFQFINETLSNPLFDIIMPFITEQDRWVPPILIAAVYGLIVGNNRVRMIIFLGILAVGLGDYISSGIFKPLVGRVRPCKELYWLNLLVSCNGKYSFVSGHATGTMLMATWFGFHFRKFRTYFLVFAVAIAFSRVYVGVHWFFDVLGGMALGYGISFILIILWKRYMEHKFKPVDIAEEVQSA